MALYAPNKPGLAEAALTMRTPAGGALTDTVTNDGQTMLNFVNTGSEHICTVETQTACNYGTTHDVTVTIPATSGNVWIGPFSTARFNDTTGALTITWGASVTGVTFAALSIGGTATG